MKTYLQLKLNIKLSSLSDDEQWGDNHKWDRRMGLGLQFVMDEDYFLLKDGMIPLIPVFD